MAADRERVAAGLQRLRDRSGGRRPWPQRDLLVAVPLPLVRRLTRR